MRKRKRLIERSGNDMTTLSCWRRFCRAFFLFHSLDSRTMLQSLFANRTGNDDLQLFIDEGRSWSISVVSSRRRSNKPSSMQHALITKATQSRGWRLLYKKSAALTLRCFMLEIATLEVDVEKELFSKLPTKEWKMQKVWKLCREAKARKKFPPRREIIIWW